MKEKDILKRLVKNDALFRNIHVIKFISGRDTTKKPVNKRIDSHTATYLLQNQEALTDKMICRCLFC